MGFPVYYSFFFVLMEMYRRKIKKKKSTQQHKHSEEGFMLFPGRTPTQLLHHPCPITQGELIQRSDRAVPNPSAQEMSAI